MIAKEKVFQMEGREQTKACKQECMCFLKREITEKTAQLDQEILEEKTCGNKFGCQIDHLIKIT